MTRFIIGLLLFGTISFADTPNLFINEFLASNASSNLDSDFFSFGDWIEIYNSEDTVVNIGGYYITDDLSNPFKFQFPDTSNIQPNSYYVVWADDENYYPGNYHINPEDIDIIVTNCHTNFKLKKSGEEVGLFSSNGDLIDSIIFDDQITDISYGRNPDGTTDWYYFSDPTPGTPNISIGYKDTIRISPPEFSLPGGFYNSSQFVEIFSDESSSTIYFTLDGSKPTVNSNTYISPITIDSTTVLRAKIIDLNYLASVDRVNTYFIGETSTLPVISITTDPDYLWDDTVGIYVGGENGTIYHGDWGSRENYGVKNYFQDWERPAFIEFYEPNGNLEFNNQLGISIYGAGSRKLPQKSLTLNARKKYGNENINYQIFPDKPIQIFETLILRNAGSDWLGSQSSTMFRDALMQTLLPNEINIDRQSYLPSIVFINREYWGIHNVRERANSHYSKSNYGIEEDDVDILGVKYWNFYGIEGDMDEYNQLINFIESNDISDPTVYNYIKTKVDIDELLNYVILQMYIANFDWPQNNIKLWKEKSNAGKWRWIINDTDGAFKRHWTINNYTTDGETNNILQWVETVNTQFDEGVGGLAIFSELLENQSFRDEFIQRSACYLNFIFEPNRISDLIDSLSININQEMPRHINRWKNICSEDSLYCSIIDSIEQWGNNILFMKQFASERPDTLRQNMIEYFALIGVGELKVNISASNAGIIMIHDQNIQSYPDTGVYFLATPIRIAAIPNEGYQFVNWQGVAGEISNSDSISIILTGDSTLTAVFEPTLSVDGKLFIPAEYSIHQNYPNPFNPTTTLRFDLPNVSDVTLTIYNMLGQRVKTFNMQGTPAGYHSVNWDATNDYGDPVGAGIYLYQLRANQFVKTRKMVLLK